VGCDRLPCAARSIKAEGRGRRQVHRRIPVPGSTAGSTGRCRSDAPDGYEDWGDTILNNCGGFRPLSRRLYTLPLRVSEWTGWERVGANSAPAIDKSPGLDRSAILFAWVFAM